MEYKKYKKLCDKMVGMIRSGHFTHRRKLRESNGKRNVTVYAEQGIVLAEI